LGAQLLNTFPSGLNAVARQLQGISPKHCARWSGRWLLAMHLISRNPDPAAVLEEANADGRTLAKPRCNPGPNSRHPARHPAQALHCPPIGRTCEKTAGLRRAAAFYRAGPSTTARSAVTRSQVLSQLLAEMRHVLLQPNNFFLSRPPVSWTTSSPGMDAGGQNDV
jgi:hypothetical protein